jgi:hypothetical protein
MFSFPSTDVIQVIAAQATTGIHFRVPTAVPVEKGSTPMSDQSVRQATMKLEHSAAGQVLSARVPSDITNAELGRVSGQALDLVRKLTGCNCMSGRIKVVIEDNFADVIHVHLT